MMHLKIISLVLTMVSLTAVLAQDKYKDRDFEPGLGKTSGIQDRAGGEHNASNIGLFFENRGKLYPRRITQGPSGEFPINSTQHYIYRINQFLGIPGNVIQARYTENEEWEALGGYHNRALAKIAMSDNPSTWHPVNGWPIKDSDGNPVFKSDQDSYCEYSDTNNSRKILNINVAQTGYAYGVRAAENLIFFKYDITNHSNTDYEDFYFALYVDMDIGNISGGDPEYGDDRIGFDKERNYVYFHDDGYSSEWPDNTTGFMGVAFLSTPEINGSQLGVTDMHYNEYFDDEDQDTIQYGILSSAESLYNSAIGPRYFHPGEDGNIHYDDPANIPESGMDLLAYASSGPYTLARGDTLTFITAIVAGETLEESYSALEVAEKIVSFDFDFVRPPQNSNLSGLARDQKVYLYWDDIAEQSFDKFTNEYDFEGYRVYRSADNGISWKMLAEYDIKNFIGNDVGLRYSYVDSTIINGFEYWYSVTAYDRGSDVVESLESPKGNNSEAVNLVAMTPLSPALGYNPVSSENVEHIGNGVSNYTLYVKPVDDNKLAENQYRLSFGYNWKRVSGNFGTEADIIIQDSSLTTDQNYEIQFLGPNRVQILDLSTGDFLEPTPKGYFSGITYRLNPGLSVNLNEPDPMNAESYPEVGDIMKISYSVDVIRNTADTVINKRLFDIEQPQTTPDGVYMEFIEPDNIKDISRAGGSDNIELVVSVDDQTAVEDQFYLLFTGASVAGDTVKVPVIITAESSGSQNPDTLFTGDVTNGESFYFGGLKAALQFEENNAPAGNNIFSVTSQIIRKPNLTDSYRFGIKGGSIDKGVISSDITNIKVVPNPYIVTSLYEPEFGELRKEPLRQIQFINLPNECTIYIFSLDADLVKTIYHTAESGTALWDLRAEGGREVAAGIYMYVVKTEDTEFKSRFAIIK